MSEENLALMGVKQFVHMAFEEFLGIGPSFLRNPIDLPTRTSLTVSTTSRAHRPALLAGDLRDLTHCAQRAVQRRVAR